MYAAAGGASLASRQARQRQRQQKKTQQLQAKLHPPKAADIVVADHGASTPTRQSRQFHQLPNSYLRTPQTQSRKLSASYTAQSKLLLPIDEGDTQSVLHMHLHSHGHSHNAHSHAHHGHQHFSNYTIEPHRASPKLVHRHSGSSGTSFHHSHLPKSATATLPLVSQVEATPPTSPSGVAVAKPTGDATSTLPTAGQEASIALPYHDSIIVTPATPMASPGHVAKPRDELSDAAAEQQPLTASADSCDDDDQMQLPTGPLERKCSVYRMRRSDAFELDSSSAVSGVKRQFKELQFNQQHQQYEPLLTDDPHMIFKGYSSSGGRKIQLCAYCEEGICICEHIEATTRIPDPDAIFKEKLWWRFCLGMGCYIQWPTAICRETQCAQGRAAWLERGRRCSVQESQTQATCHRRWVKRNRIQDASLGGSSDDEDFLGVLRGPSTFANAFLYVGLGTIALGLVIAFVGTGEKGFKTVELRLIGPSLIGIGFVCCMLRILFCICPSHCISPNKNARKRNGNKVDADHTTSLLRGESKRVSIARSAAQQARYPITHKRSNSKMLNEGIEALRQIATTSLFMQNEQKPMTNRIVPIIKEPESANVDGIEHSTINNSKDPKMTPEVVPSETKNSNSNETNKHSLTSTAVVKSPPSNHEDKDYSVPVSSGFNNKLSRQRVSVHQQNPAAQLLNQPHSNLGNEDNSQQMETSLMFVRNPKLTHESRSPPRCAPTEAPISSINCTTADSNSIPNVHMTNVARSGLVMAKEPAQYTFTPNSTANTYAAALAAAISSRGNTERSESLIRGPLGMPMHVLAASTSAYALPTSAPSICLVKTSTSAQLPAPSTAPSILSSNTCEITSDNQSIPGQVAYELPISNVLTTVPNPLPNSCESNYSSINFNFPASSMLTSKYKGSSSALSPNCFFSSTLLTTQTSLQTSVSKYEPELLLSPAKLGQ